MILEVEHLKVQFPTRRGTLTAVDDVSFSIAPGEVLGVVGESGAGKSITGMAVIGLLDPPGRIAAGEVRLEGRRIDNLPHEELRRIRGRRIGVIFQDPLTSLNPALHHRPAARGNHPDPLAADTEPRPGSGRYPCCARSASPRRRRATAAIRTISPAGCASAW